MKSFHQTLTVGVKLLPLLQRAFIFSQMSKTAVTLQRLLL